MFDFGGVVDGYCSDFGRTIYCGEPPADVPRGLRRDARRPGGRAAPPRAPGTPAREVNAACRRPIEEAGLGEHFRHRMGHGIGMDVHERPFISTEDETPLEPGMTFTDEPSIIIPGRFSVRIEDIVVCEEGGGRKLGSYPTALVANRPSLLRRDLRDVDVVLGVVDRVLQVTRRDEHLRRLHQREVRPALRSAAAGSAGRGSCGQPARS